MDWKYLAACDFMAMCLRPLLKPCFLVSLFQIGATADLKAGTSIENTSHSSRCRASLLVAAEGPPSASAQMTVSSSVSPAAFKSSFCARLSGWSESSD